MLKVLPYNLKLSRERAAAVVAALELEVLTELN
jgi:hypothetical protein